MESQQHAERARLKFWLAVLVVAGPIGGVCFGGAAYTAAWTDDDAAQIGYGLTTLAWFYGCAGVALMFARRLKSKGWTWAIVIVMVAGSCWLGAPVDSGHGRRHLMIQWLFPPAADVPVPDEPDPPPGCFGEDSPGDRFNPRCRGG